MALALTLAFLVVGCGAGDSSVDDVFESFDGGSVGTAPLVIKTTSVPAGKPGITYPVTTLEAEGASDVTWRITGGTLPPGIWLTADGRLLGTPSNEGFYEFTTQATTDAASAQQDLAIAVGEFGVRATDGLQFGDAWSGHPVTLRAAGHEGHVTFTLGDNRSGGRLSNIDPVGGTATYIPGTQVGTDLITVRDSATGATESLALDVVEDPTATHEARFDGHDVWVIDWHAKRGAHAFATDLRAAMAQSGLRSATGYGAGETETDRLCELAVQVSILQHINQLFLRNADGSMRPESLPISFPFRRPGAGYVAPGAGTLFSGRSNAYSVMALCDLQATLAAVGMAFGDSIGNANHEHNAPGGAHGELGVFVNVIAESVQTIFRLHGAELVDTPIHAGDLEALKAILHGRPSPGGRYDAIRYRIDALASSIAYVTAHEIGHSLGLEHNFTYVPGGIMNRSAILAPGADYHFTAENLAILRMGLPGPGRMGLQALKVATGIAATAAMAPTGMHVCGGCGR